MRIQHEDVVSPLAPLAVSIEGAQTTPSIKAIAPDGKPAFVRRVLGRSGGTLWFSGLLGEHTLLWRCDGQEVARTTVRLEAQTRIQTSDPRDQTLFHALRQIVDADSKVVAEGDRKIRTHPDWVRDHIHKFITSPDDYHLGFVKPEFVYVDEEKACFSGCQAEGDSRLSFWPRTTRTG